MELYQFGFRVRVWTVRREREKLFFAKVCETAAISSS
jgi:hypothetical protein